MKVFSELAQDRRAWGASDRDGVNQIGDAASTRAEWMSKQEQASIHTIAWPEFSGMAIKRGLMWRIVKYLWSGDIRVVEADD